MAQYTAQTIGAESGGNAFLKNPRSSASGSGQFINSTWLQMLRKHRPDIAADKSDQELIALKTDPVLGPQLGQEMTAAYEDENTSFLQKRGIDPNAGNVYLAHFAGPAGAAAIHANPGATVEALLGESAVAANPFLRGKTGADVIDWAAGKMSPAKHMAKSLRQRYGSEGNAGAEGVKAPAASAGVDRLKSALTGKSYDAEKISAGDQMIGDGRKIGSEATGWLGALGGIGLSLGGNYIRTAEAGQKKEHDAALREGLSGAKDSMEAARLLMGSSDPKQQAMGVELFNSATKAAKESAESYGKTPIWGTDAAGNPALVQVSDKGRGTQTALPPGVKIGKDPIKMDAGTHFVLLDPVTRQQIGTVPKDVAGEAKQKVLGEEGGKRTMAQPATIANVRSSLSGLDRLTEAATALKAAPGLPGATGSLQGQSWVPTFRQDTANAESDMETLKSQVAFNVLQAMRDASKSGGALGSIAVEELRMLQNNLASLDTTQGTEKFKASLDKIAEYAQGAKTRLLQGYQDTYGAPYQDTGEAAPAAAPDAAAERMKARQQKYGIR